MSYELTAGEQRVARVLVTGASNKAIAETTGLTLATVKLHVHEILQKLQVQNRTQAALRLLTPVAAQR